MTEVWQRVPRVGRDKNDSTEDVSLRDLLLLLGDSPDAVAKSLYDLGCKGPQYNDCFCPVARYITQRTDKAASATSLVCASGHFTYDGDDNIDTFVGEQWTRTPDQVAQVITAYDRGSYAFLRG